VFPTDTEMILRKYGGGTSAIWRLYPYDTGAGIMKNGPDYSAELNSFCQKKRSERERDRERRWSGSGEELDDRDDRDAVQSNAVSGERVERHSREFSALIFLVGKQISTSPDVMVNSRYLQVVFSDACALWSSILVALAT
jgi:hypothetical protein